MRHIWKFLNIKPEERRPAGIMAGYLFLLTAVYIFGNVVTPSIFFARVGNEARLYWPLMMTVNAMVATPLILLFNRLVKRMALNQIAVWTQLLFLAALLALQIVLQFSAWAAAFMYVLVVAGFTVSIVQYYLIAGTIFDARQSKRILGLIGIGGSLAGILSGLLNAPIVAFFSQPFLLGVEKGAESVIYVMLALMGFTILVIRTAKPYMNESTASTDPRKPDTPQKIVFDRYLITLMMIIASFILVATVLDYQFQVTTADYFGTNEQALSSYKGIYSAAAGGIQLLMRLVVVGPVLVNFGILAGMLVLPITVILSTIAFIFQPAVWSATLMKGGDQSVRFTLNETASELAWAPISPQQRLLAKPFVNGTYIAIVQGVTGLLLFSVKWWETQTNTLPDMRVFSFLVLAVCAVWIPSTLILRRGYIQKLMDSLRGQDIQLEDLNIDTADSAIVRLVDNTLRQGDDIERAFALEIIRDVRVTPWAATLGAVLRKTESIPLQESILQLAGRYPETISDAELYKLIERPNPLTNEAIVAASERNLANVVPLLLQRLDDPDLEIKAAAAQALVSLNDAHAEQALKTLYNMLQSTQEQENLHALAALNSLMSQAQPHASLSANVLRPLLMKSNVVRMRVLELLTVSTVPLLSDVVKLLGELPLTDKARTALRGYPANEVRQELLRQYQSSSSTVNLRVGISRALKDYLNTDITPVMLAALDDENRAVFNNAVDTLLDLSRKGLVSNAQLEPLERYGIKLAQTMYSLAIAIRRLRNLQDDVLMLELLELDFQEAYPAMLKLAVMDKPEIDIASLLHGMQNRQPNILNNALELLDNVLSAAEREVIIPLFEDRTPDELIAIGKKHYPNIDDTLEDELLHYVNYGNPWEVGVALNYIMRHPELNIHIGRAARNITEESRLLIAKPGSGSAADTLLHRPGGEEEKMYSILEKTVLLKKSTLFATLNARDLYYIAQITDEKNLQAGEILFQHGDPADAMYIIGTGQMRIYVDNHEIARIQEGDAIGEVAILDGRPRTAGAQALTDCRLLVIYAQDFFETVSIHTAINQSIMRMLAARIRELLEPNIVPTVPPKRIQP